MYIAKSEGANFRLSRLSGLQFLRVEDILIACTDKLTGFADAVKSIFPDAAVLIYIVRQIRNSIKYAAGKNQKEFMRDLKLGYRYPGKAQVEAEPYNPELKYFSFSL
ncbi:MAG: transposase [Prevotellaceae bacterium]|jgi:transposase-like protein|nr:transposase [Prevotellaceae bacterium]